MQVLIRKLIKWWDARRRNIDLKILWPECKRLCNDIDVAKAVFAVHCFNDDAWTDHFSRQELYHFIDNLT